jgi:hypothetical protein
MKDEVKSFILRRFLAGFLSAARAIGRPPIGGIIDG